MINLKNTPGLIHLIFYDVMDNMRILTKLVCDIVKNITVSEAVTAVSGIVGIMKTERIGEMAAVAGIAAGTVAAIELLSEAISSLEGKDYSQVYLPQNPYLTQIATYIPSIPKELFKY
jgi:hypothetical protein